MKTILCVMVALLVVSPVRADVRSKMAREAADAIVARFGSKAAAEGVPALARRIETYAARYGEETFQAMRRVGPRAFELVDSAGSNGAKAMRVLATHGEAGATCVLKRPKAMAQFVRFGEDGASVLVKHPGVAERVVEQGGLPAVKAMAAIGPQNGRRVAMLMEGELGKAARSKELLEVIAQYGDRAAAFVWSNKGALATGTALTAFLANPGPFIDGTKDIAKVAGESAVGVTKSVGEHVVAPVIGGVFTVINVVLGMIGVLIAAATALMWKHGLPRPELIKAVIRKW